MRRTYVFLLFLLFTVVSRSLSACSVPPSYYPYMGSSWAAGSAIYLDTSGLGGYARFATNVPMAANNWNVLLQGATIPYIMCNPPSFGGGDGIHSIVFVLQVILTDPSTGQLIRGVRHVTGYDALGQLGTVEIDLDVLITDDQAIREVVAHELAHTLGLLDCVQCGVNSTVMETTDPVPAGQTA
jgi:hypothetical protein